MGRELSSKSQRENGGRMAARRTYSLAVAVKKSGRQWNWSVSDVDSRPPALLGLGSAPTRLQAFNDAAMVVADEGEDDA